MAISLNKSVQAFTICMVTCSTVWAVFQQGVTYLCVVALVAFPLPAMVAAVNYPVTKIKMHSAFVAFTYQLVQT